MLRSSVAATDLPDLYYLLAGCPDNIIEYYREVVAGNVAESSGHPEAVPKVH